MSDGYDLKHAGARLDFPIQWSAELAQGETISTVSTTVDPVENGGVTVKSGTDTFSGTLASPVLEGGIAGRRYVIKQVISTNQGRTDIQERTVLVN